MAETCTLQIHRTASGYVFRVVGRGTMHSSPTVQQFIGNAIEGGADVVLDLSACEYLDSTFLGCLITLHQRGSKGAGSFAVHADPPVREELLGSVQLDRVLAFVEQCPATSGGAVALSISEVDRTQFCQHLVETHHHLAQLGGPGAEKFRAIAAELSKELDGLN